MIQSELCLQCSTRTLLYLFVKNIGSKIVVEHGTHACKIVGGTWPLGKSRGSFQA
jgi:hypothetical protein